MQDFDLGHTFRSNIDVRYRNLQKLSSGGNSSVYLAIAESGTYEGVMFAVKVFTKIEDKNRLHRFDQEYEYLRDIAHPSIMKVYDKGISLATKEGKEYDVPFLVAEYLPTTLNDQIHIDISLLEKISCTYQLISALDFIHTQKRVVVHRDIKPKNILIKGKSCLIGDFGLMKILSEADDYDGDAYIQTLDTTMPRYYRTPDLVDYANDKKYKLTAKSDIFQLGLITAELFTKKNPCRPPKKNNREPVVLDDILEIPGKAGKHIQAEIQKMIKVNPAERPAARDLLEPWKAIFFSVVAQSQEIDGKAF